MEKNSDRWMNRADRSRRMPTPPVITSAQFCAAGAVWVDRTTM
jgi:hypothetical protein